MLEDGLHALLKKIEPLKAELLKLRERFSLTAYCGHFGSGLGGGPRISVDTLRRLSELGLELDIQTYWSTVEPDA